MEKDLPEEIVSRMDWKFRHIRYVDRNARFVKARKKIRSYGELMRFLSRQRYLDAYYSVARFVNPHKISARKKAAATEDLFLGMDLFFDIDFDDSSMEENIAKAMKETKKIVKYGKKKKWRRKYIAFSGSKGFHVSYEDPFSYRARKPWEREEEAIKKRKALVKRMQKEKIKFDTKITVDSRRIVRVPGTYNSKTGYKCTIIPAEWLERGAAYVLKNVERKVLWGKRSPFARAMTLLRNCAKISGKGFLPNLSAVSYIVGITSNYKKRHVIFLEVRSIARAREALEEMNVPFVVLRSPLGKRFVFSPAVVQRTELGRLAKKIDSPSSATLEKYNHTTILYQYLNSEMKELGRLSVTEERLVKTKKLVSRTHADMFASLKQARFGNEKEAPLHYVLLEYDREKGMKEAAKF